jgi:curli biogenesis system outer membrane secretion channel CsgG
MFLIDQLSGGNVRAIAVSSEADARAAGATYILTSDISKLKQSKAGGLFGAVTGISAAAKFDAQVDYKLVKLADGSMVLSSKAASKSETEANAAAQNILGMEAVAVLGAIR